MQTLHKTEGRKMEQYTQDLADGTHVVITRVEGDKGEAIEFEWSRLVDPPENARGPEWHPGEPQRSVTTFSVPIEVMDRYVDEVTGAYRDVRPLLERLLESGAELQRERRIEEGLLLTGLQQRAVARLRDLLGLQTQLGDWDWLDGQRNQGSKLIIHTDEGFKFVFVPNDSKHGSTDQIYARSRPANMTREFEDRVISSLEFFGYWLLDEDVRKRYIFKKDPA